MLQTLIVAAKERGHHSIIAGIDGEQDASIRLHSELGFKIVGRIPEAGIKFERWLELVYMQLLLR